MMNALSDGMMILVILLVSVVAVIISVICIRFLLLTRMEKERKEMGMLRAIGMAKGQIRGLWFAKYVAFSAAGALIGLLLTGLAQKPLTAQMQELYGGVAIGGSDHIRSGTRGAAGRGDPASCDTAYFKKNGKTAGAFLSV